MDNAEIQRFGLDHKKSKYAQKEEAVFFDRSDSIIHFKLLR